MCRTQYTRRPENDKEGTLNTYLIYLQNIGNSLHTVTKKKPLRLFWIILPFFTVLLLLGIYERGALNVVVHAEAPSGTQGDAQALYQSALLYSRGKQGVPKDLKMAEHYLILASEAGHREAQTQLGMLYANGSKAQRNDVEARRWLEKPAKQGDAIAQFTLAQLYQTGRGGPPRLKEALMLYQNASKQGYLPAYTALGMTYATGTGTPPDLKQAFRYYEFAATHGEALAQYKLGLMYETGLGTSKNVVKALGCLMQAEAQHFKKAKTLRQTLEATLSPQQIEAAKQFQKSLVLHASKL